MFAIACRKPLESVDWTSAPAGTARLMLWFSFVSVNPDGHACDVDTLRVSRSAVAETTVPVSVTTNGVPAFAAKRSFCAACR